MVGHKIHPQLIEDCHVLGERDGGTLLLHRNAAVPWFILVPDTDREELLQLPTEQLTTVMRDAACIADYIRERFQLEKVNVAALGNVVPQLHLHLVGRRPGDPCWPRPVWGNLEQSAEWPEETVAEFRNALGRNPNRENTR